MTSYLRYCILIFLLTSGADALLAQDKWELKIHSDSFGNDGMNAYSFPDSLAMDSFISREVSALVAEGRLSAALDSVVLRDKTFHAYIFSGPKVVISRLRDTRVRRMDYEELVKLSVKDLEERENGGYPFARSTIEFAVAGDTVLVEDQLRSGSYFILDSLIQLGSLVMDTRALSAHLRLHEGEPYNEEKLKKMDSRLKRLPFVKVIRPSQVIFSRDRYRLLLAIEKRKANSANGIIGFLPDAAGKVRTTGEIDLLLNNALNKADRMSLKWRRIQDGSQSLDLAIGYPYLFGSPLGINGSINQFRQDSTFNQIQIEGGLSLLLENGDVISAELERRDFNNLLSETFSLANANSSSLLYGARYLHNTLDDPFNPYEGMDLKTRLAYGSKSLVTSSEDMGSDEQTLDTWEVTLDVKQFFPLGGRSTLLMRANAFHQESDLILFKELQRIGGLFTLRGIDELSIRASTFGIFTAEYRFLTDERAYISAFTDVAYHSSDVGGALQEDTPYGVGLGTAFDTGGGVFTLSYALGSQFGSPLSFRTGKIHFGFIALF